MTSLTVSCIVILNEYVCKISTKIETQKVGQILHARFDKWIIVFISTNMGKSDF